MFIKESVYRLIVFTIILIFIGIFILTAFFFRTQIITATDIKEEVNKQKQMFDTKTYQEIIKNTNSTS